MAKGRAGGGAAAGAAPLSNNDINTMLNDEENRVMARFPFPGHTPGAISAMNTQVAEWRTRELAAQRSKSGPLQGARQRGILVEHAPTAPLQGSGSRPLPSRARPPAETIGVLSTRQRNLTTIPDGVSNSMWNRSTRIGSIPPPFRGNSPIADGLARTFPTAQLERRLAAARASETKIAATMRNEGNFRLSGAQNDMRRRVELLSLAVERSRVIGGR